MIELEAESNEIRQLAADFMAGKPLNRSPEFIELCEEVANQENPDKPEDVERQIQAMIDFIMIEDD